MRRLIGFIFKLAIAAVFLFLLSAALVVFVGSVDQGQKADVALVTDYSSSAKGGLYPVLDRVGELYKAGEVSSVMVIGSAWKTGSQNDVNAMVKHLEARGIPATAITENNHGGSLQETSRLVAGLMKENGFDSVMIVANYYNIVGLKLALKHEGVVNVGQVHVGQVRKEDALEIGNSVFALYDYVGKIYLAPEAKQVEKEAQVGMDKASEEAQKAKDKVNNGLDSLAK